MRKSLLIILSSLMVVMMVLFGCTVETPPETPPENPPQTINFELNYEEYRLSVGQQVVLCVDDPELNVVWTSANEQIAVVEDGKVTALNEGATLIKAKVEDVEKSCRIFVSAVEMPSRIHLEAPSSLMVSKSAELNLFFDFAKVTNNVVWSSSNEQIAIIENGTITGLSEGQVEITATYTHDGQTYTATSQISIVIFTDIKFAKSSVTLASLTTVSGTANDVNTTCKPVIEVIEGQSALDASQLDIEFKSKDENVATVDQDGTIIANNIGETQIIAAYKGIKTSINVIVGAAIASKADLDKLGYATKEDPSLLAVDKYYVLTQDIDYNGAELVPIAANPSFIVTLMRYGRTDYADLNPDFVPFAATLDGMGHVIKNAYIPSTVMVSTDHQFTLGSAFIGKLTGTVKNIGFVNLRTQLVANESSKFNTSINDVEFDAITDTVTFSGLVNTNQGMLKNIYLDMKIYKKNYGKDYASGALVANAESGTIKNCIVLSEQNFEVQGYKPYTGSASDIIDFGAAIGKKGNTVISNVYAVSATLTKFVANDGSLSTLLYQDLATFFKEKKDDINNMDKLWSVKNGELTFGDEVVARSTESDSIEFAKSSVELYTPLTFRKVSNTINTSADLPELTLKLDNQIANINVSNLQLSSENTNVATIENGKLVAKGVGTVKINATYEGLSTSLTVYVRDVLASKADLDYLAYSSRGGYHPFLDTNTYYVLVNDIDYNGAELQPIGANPRLASQMEWGRTDYPNWNDTQYWFPFKGTIDGKGYVIKNAYIPSMVMVSSQNEFTMGSAFIGKLTGTLKNIGFVNLQTKLVADEQANFNTNCTRTFDKITDTQISSGLVSTNEGTIENVYLDMKIYKKSYVAYCCGALVGNASKGTIINCVVVSEKDYSKSTAPLTPGNYIDYGAVIGTNDSTTITNVFAVSSTLAKYDATGNIASDVYKNVSSLLSAKASVIAEFDGPWSLSGNQLKFGNIVIA